MRCRYSLLLFVLLAIVLSASAAGAVTVSYVAGVPLQTTNWYTTLTFPQFNPSLGSLTGVTVELRDSLVHGIQFENQAATNSRFRDSIYVTIDVMRPASTSLVTAIAKLYKTAIVGPWDGVLDYAGTSGAGFLGLTDYAVSSSTTNAPADLALFTGTGSIGLPCRAEAWFVFSYTGGNGKWIETTEAQAYVIVTYTYDAPVGVAPTSWGRLKTLFR